MCGYRNFLQGGGVQVSLTKKSSDKVVLCFFYLFFLYLFFLVLSLYFKWSISKLSVYKVPEGVQHFPEGGGGVQLFPVGGGSTCLFPIETHITCNFPGGSRPPVPPLDPHMQEYAPRMQGFYKGGRGQGLVYSSYSSDMFDTI